jgi:hypothetical protein
LFILVKGVVSGEPVAQRAAYSYRSAAAAIFNAGFLVIRPSVLFIAPKIAQS